METGDIPDFSVARYSLHQKANITFVALKNFERQR
jgi:hypothetical protein